ncbi:MAG: Tyrosine-protein kinase etk, partial [Pseudomonadota bacterium]
LPAAGTNAIGAPSADILVSQRMEQVIVRLKGAYDTIVIDAPPLLPVVDARILAGYADQIVMTMNWQTTSKRQTQQALRILAINARKVAGIVLNGTDPAEFKSRMSYRAPTQPGPLARINRAA